MSQRFHLSSTFSGISLLALGTSLPELLISITSVMKGAEGLAFGNVVGSNVFNSLLIGGMLFFFGLRNKGSYLYELLFLLLSLILFIAFFYNQILSFPESFVLLLLLGVFLYLIAKQYKNSPETQNSAPPCHIGLSLVIFLTASLFLFIGSEMTVKGTQGLGKLFHWPDRVSGAIILAVGTGLPEFVTSLLAVLKKKGQMALGNIFGSNIFNLCIILTFASLVSQKAFILKNPLLYYDLIWLAFSTLLFIFSILIANKFIEKKMVSLTLGSVSLASYVYYVLTIIN